MSTIPTEAAQTRYLTLDVIRGLAVMGILSVNIVNFSMVQAAYLNPQAYRDASISDLVLWAVNMLLVDGKFRSLFSMLFGASMLLVIDKAEAAGEWGAGLHVRRMAVLLLLGLVHAILIWHGDILALYAMAGLIALLWARSSVSRMLAAAITLALVHTILFGAIAATLVHQDIAAHAPNAAPEMVRNWNANASSVFAIPSDIARDQAVYGGSWPGIVAHEWSKLWAIFSNSLALMPDTLSLMLVGMAGYRSGFLTGAWDDGTYRRIAIWGIGIGLIGHAALVVADLMTGFYVPLVLGGFLAAMVPFRFAQALGYAALFVLWSRKNSGAVKRVAAVGRAAFTNYIATSLICTAIFYGWGLGLYGKLTRVEAWLVVPLVWALMLLWSKPWLERFRYGPLEWLWRSLARGRPQAMRKP